MKQKLFGRISKDNILELCFLTQGDKNDHRKEEFYRLTFDEDNRRTRQTLWGGSADANPKTMLPNDT